MRITLPRLRSRAGAQNEADPLRRQSVLPRCSEQGMMHARDCHSSLRSAGGVTQRGGTRPASACRRDPHPRSRRHRQPRARRQSARRQGNRARPRPAAHSGRRLRGRGGRIGERHRAMAKRNAGGGSRRHAARSLCGGWRRLPRLPGDDGHQAAGGISPSWWPCPLAPLSSFRPGLASTRPPC